MTVRGVDYSHYQCPPSTGHAPDLERMQRDGVEFVILKAWEGNSPDPDFAANLRNARAAGMPVMAYVYLHASDDEARMQACFDVIGDTVLCLDWEDADTPAAIVEAWMDAYEDHFSRRGLCYYGLYPPAEATPRIGEWPRWFPRYAAAPGLLPWDGMDPEPDWRECWAIWQSSCSGRVDGIDGPVDLDELAPALTLSDLLAWLADDGSGPPPKPAIDVVKVAIAGLQRALNAEGYDAGTVDGLWGPHTQSAIDRYAG